MLLQLSGLLCTSLIAQAQFSETHSLFYNAYDLKHYAVAPIPGTGDYLMAGTIFNYGGIVNNNAVHWLHFDNTGNLVASKVVDDANYDQRAIGIHEFNGTAVTVAGIVGLAGGQSSIEIITQDLAGNPITSTVVNSSDPSYPSMFPLSSLQYNNKELFICGYVTSDPAGVQPDLSSPKEAFVLKFDVTANVVVDVHYFSSPVISGYDYDMATRMKAVKNGIWVGGSVNGGPMMNRVIDPVTLNDVYAVHFGIPYPYGYESSFDVHEETNGDLFVFGNVYANYSLPQPSAMPMFVHVTGCNSSLVPYPGISRWQFSSYDYAWGVNVLPDRSSDQNVILNGFASNRRCNSAPYTTSSNINPFLAMLQLRMIGGNINVTPLFWNTLQSYNGTGTMSLSNSYFAQGGYRSNNAWTPVTAARDYSVSPDIVLSAPVWNTGTNMLNIKYVKANGKGQLSSCAWISDCGISNYSSPVSLGASQSNMSFPYNQSGSGSGFADFWPDFDGSCSNGQYKPTGIAETPQAAAVRLYPNPASTTIRLEWTASGTGNASISVMDMMGRTVLQQELPAAGHADVSVRQLAPGAYHYILRYGPGESRGIFVKQ